MMIWKLRSKKAGNATVKKLNAKPVRNASNLTWIMTEAGPDAAPVYQSSWVPGWLAEQAGTLGCVPVLTWLLGLDAPGQAQRLRQRCKRLYDMTWVRAAAAAAGAQHGAAMRLLSAVCTAPGQPCGPTELPPHDQALLLRGAVRACARACTSAPTSPCTDAIHATLAHLIQLCRMSPCKPLPWQPAKSVDAGAMLDALTQAAECNCAVMLEPLVAAGAADLASVGGGVIMSAAKAAAADFLRKLAALPCIKAPSEEGGRAVEGWPAIWQAAIRNAQSLAVVREDTGCLLALLDMGVPLSAPHLTRLVEAGREALADAVVRHPTCRQLALHQRVVDKAARKGLAALMATCLELGVSDYAAGMALVLAAQHAHTEVVRLLLGSDLGATPDFLQHVPDAILHAAEAAQAASGGVPAPPGLQPVLQVLLARMAAYLDFLEARAGGPLDQQQQQQATTAAAAQAPAGAPDQSAAGATQPGPAQQPQRTNLPTMAWWQVLLGAVQQRDLAMATRLLACPIITCPVTDAVIHMAAATAQHTDVRVLVLLLDKGAALDDVLAAVGDTGDVQLLAAVLREVEARAEAEAAKEQAGGSSDAVWDDLFGWLTPGGVPYTGPTWRMTTPFRADRLVEMCADVACGSAPSASLPEPDAAHRAAAQAALHLLLHSHKANPAAALLVPASLGHRASADHAACLRQLLDAHGGPALMGACGHSAAAVAAGFARSGSPELLALVVAHGACPNSALAALAADRELPNRLQSAEQLLQGVPLAAGAGGMARADIGWQDSEVLRQAASAADGGAMMRLLVTHGACVQAALLSAVQGGHAQVAMALIADHGADPFWRGGAALHAAATKADVDMVQQLLALWDDYGCLYDGVAVALTAAAASGHARLVHILLTVYAPNIAGQGGGVVFHDTDLPVRMAAQHGHMYVVATLLERGASPHAALYGACLGRQTDADAVRREQQLQLAAWLLREQCADPHWDGLDWCTAVQLAVDAGDEPLANMLLDVPAPAQ